MSPSATDSSPPISGRDIAPSAFMFDRPDPLEELDALRDQGLPVQEIPIEGTPSFIILGYEAVQRAFLNIVDLPGSAFFKQSTQPLFDYVISTTTTGDEHRFHLAQLMPSLNPAAIRARLESILRLFANALIDEFPNEAALEANDP